MHMVPVMSLIYFSWQCEEVYYVARLHRLHNSRSELAKIRRLHLPMNS